MVLGLDLGKKSSQLSYMLPDGEVPVTVSAVAGEEKFEIPTVIARVYETQAWVIGKEAIKLSEEGRACLAEDIYDRAISGSIITVDGDDYEAVDLLFLFIKKVLALTAFIFKWQEAKRLTICAQELTNETLELLSKLADMLDYPRERIDFISKSEAFYEYILHQKEELWLHDVVLFDYSGQGLSTMIFSVDRRTKPAVCKIMASYDKNFDSSDDEAFMSCAMSVLEGRIVTSVHLVGEGMLEETIPKTLRYICVKRRAFQGRNLYTRGAAFAAFDKEYPSALSKAYLFLGRDRLKSNIGLRVIRDHEEIYEPLVDAGVNWYDVHKSFEAYLGAEKEIRLLLTPLTGHNEHCAVIRLGVFPARPPRCTKVLIDLKMKSEDVVTVNVTDLGFGEIFPATEKVVTEDITLHSEV